MLVGGLAVYAAASVTILVGIYDIHKDPLEIASSRVISEQSICHRLASVEASCGRSGAVRCFLNLVKAPSIPVTKESTKR